MVDTMKLITCNLRNQNYWYDTVFDALQDAHFQFNAKDHQASCKIMLSG